MALIVGGVLTDGGRRGALLGCGFALVSLAGPGAGAPRALRGLPLALDAAGRGLRDRRRRAAVPVDRSAAGRPARHRHRRLRPRADAPAPRLPRALGRDGVPRMTELPTPEPRRMRLLGLHHVTMICATCSARRPSIATCSVSPSCARRSTTTTRTRATSGSATATGRRARCCPSWSTRRWSPGRWAWAPCTTWPWRWPAADELDAWRDYLRSRSVDCTDVFDRGGLRSIYLRDPDGNIVEIATASG